MQNSKYALILMLSFSIKAETDISPLCPILDLNATTQFYFEKSIDRLFSKHEYQDDLINKVIHEPASFNDLRLLKTETDSAVCQKLNERFDSLSARYRYDRELGRYMPEVFAVFYEVQNKYIVFIQSYNPGSDIEGHIGAPGTGWRFANIYDKKNLNFIGRIDF